MTSGRRLTLRRSQRDLCDNFVLGITIILSLGFVVFLFRLSSSIVARSSVRPTFHLYHHATLNVDLDVVSHQSSLSQRNALNHVSDGFSQDTDDAVEMEMIVQTTDSADSESLIEEINRNGAGDDVLQKVGGKYQRKIVSRVAFGSCTSRRPIEQPIWREGVIPSNPDAWIWCLHLFFPHLQLYFYTEGILSISFRCHQRKLL